MFQGKRFEDLKLEDIYQMVNASPAKVQKGARIHEVLAAMVDHPASRIGHRVGVRESTALSFAKMLKDLQKESAESVMDKVRPVKRLTSLKDALNLMVEDRVNDLPVVDDDYKLIGELVTLELFQAAIDLFEE
jgi:CBS domain-containing protein